jgi:hypothetical protein
MSKYNKIENSMKKLIVCFSVLAVIVIAAVVFSFCTKQTETVNNVHSDKVQKAGMVRSSPIEIQPGLCIILEIVCTQIGNTCVIDGNFYVVACNNPTKIIDQGTYHIQNSGNGWTWGQLGNGVPCGCINTIPQGITVNELLGLVNDPLFPVSCCGAGGIVGASGVIKLPSGKCVTLNITCSKGEIHGSFEEVDCNTGKPLRSGVFCAKYQGDPNNPNEFNDPNKWFWCGDPNAPSDILDVLKNMGLVPCI